MSREPGRHGIRMSAHRTIFLIGFLPPLLAPRFDRVMKTVDLKSGKGGVRDEP